MALNTSYSKPASLAQTYQNLDYFLAFGFGSGLVKFAPGTAGTVAAVPLVWLLSFLPDIIVVVVVVLAFIIGVGVCERVSKRLGSEDPSAIVWDEIVGFAITMLLAPSSVYVWVTGFFLFRLFDIVKPWPIRQIERKVKGGLGIMLDDVLAGLCSFFILQLLIFYEYF